MKGNATKNQETPSYPLSQIQLRTITQKNAKITLISAAIKGIPLNKAIKIDKTTITKYNFAGLHKLSKRGNIFILYTNKIIFLFLLFLILL
jgi:hypothetical protein